LGDEIVLTAFGVRPVRGENLIGLAPEQQIERLRELFADRLSADIVKIWGDPPAIFESTRAIFLRPARRLHDSVKRNHRGGNDFPHGPSPSLRLRHSHDERSAAESTTAEENFRSVG